MHILAIRVGRLGDIIMTTPALNAILQCYPEAELTVLTGPDGKRILKDYNPRVREIWTWNRHSIIQSYKDQKEIRRRTEQAKFDKIFCFDTSPSIASLFKDSTSEFHWFKGSKTTKHISRHYLELVASTTQCNIDNLYNHLAISDQAKIDVDKELENYGITPADKVVMIHPTFSGFRKFWLPKRKARKHRLWPAGNFADLARALAKTRLNNGSTPKIFTDVVPDESDYAKKLVAASDNTILLLEPRLNFDRYKALINRADVLICSNTGPMHIASALKTRIVAFFSMWNPEDCGPYMPKDLYTILETKNTEQGIAAITVEETLKAVVTQLNKLGNR